MIYFSMCTLVMSSTWSQASTSQLSSSMFTPPLALKGVDMKFFLFKINAFLQFSISTCVSITQNKQLRIIFIKLSWYPFSIKQFISQYLHKLFPPLQQNFLRFTLCIWQYSAKAVPNFDLDSCAIRCPSEIWVFSLFQSCFIFLNICSKPSVYETLSFLALCWLIRIDLLIIISLKVPMKVRFFCKLQRLIFTRPWIESMQRIKFINIFIFAAVC